MLCMTASIMFMLDVLFRDETQFPPPSSTGLMGGISLCKHRAGISLYGKLSLNLKPNRWLDACRRQLPRNEARQRVAMRASTPVTTCDLIRCGDPRALRKRDPARKAGRFLEPLCDPYRRDPGVAARPGCAGGGLCRSRPTGPRRAFPRGSRMTRELFGDFTIDISVDHVTFNVRSSGTLGPGFCKKEFEWVSRSPGSFGLKVSYSLLQNPGLVQNDDG